MIVAAFIILAVVALGTIFVLAQALKDQAKFWGERVKEAEEARDRAIAGALANTSPVAASVVRPRPTPAEPVERYHAIGM